jgi:bifunctional DNA-binding transcriptional regulator/antitoxin component of YhaV-PrlF toxin-antitoxin module
MAIPNGARPAVEAEGELRDKNQITVPKAIVDAVGARPGDRFVFVIEDGDRDVFQVRRIRESYEGILAGVYGTPEDAQAYLRGEDAAWDE